ncbi:MAG: BMP family ABC transporter substrate-binding protein [Acidiferrobacterales bacterium]|nr:BMP family ABC transporter substrate-binding protein [Acidiferrobacterales bacterium]
MKKLSSAIEFASAAIVRYAFFIVLAAVLFLGLSPLVQASEKPLKIGFISASEIGPFGWTYSHDLGRMELEKHFGERIRTAVYAENNADESTVEAVLQNMLEDGYKMIFGLAYEYSDLLHRYAKQYPDVAFEICTGSTIAQNVSTYSARFYEGRFAAGALAAKMSSTGKIGYIGSVPIPEVVRGINSVALGAKRVSPDSEVLALYINSWSDPELEIDAALFLISEGADVLITHTNAQRALVVAEQHGIWGFGKASDMTFVAPNAHLATIANDWGQYYIHRVDAMLDGSWEPIQNWGGKFGPTTKLTHYNKAQISPDVIEFVQTMENQVRSGKLHPFAGPINGIQGDLAVPDSKVLSDTELHDMNWYVEGVRLY